MLTLLDQKVVLETHIRPIIEKCQASEVSKDSIVLLLELHNANVYASDGSYIGTEVNKFLSTFVDNGTHNDGKSKTFVNNKFVGQSKRCLIKKETA